MTDVIMRRELCVDRVRIRGMQVQTKWSLESKEARGIFYRFQG